MKFAAGTIVFSIILATVYGVLFSIVYPLTQISSGVVTLCAILGLATCLIAVGIWKTITKEK
jgi:hypothetical protein